MPFSLFIHCHSFIPRHTPLDFLFPFLVRALPKHNDPPLARYGHRGYWPLAVCGQCFCDTRNSRAQKARQSWLSR